MIRIAKIPLSVEFFIKALNDTTIRRLPQERPLTLKRLKVRYFYGKDDLPLSYQATQIFALG
ncbi:hypothetical protein VP22_0212980 [Escherichia fergusonii]|nr:hypothetical protein ERIG_02684 [Escherichia fergusonii B253]KWW04390.1 hypothetical protein VP22_0212980 [Escherichia fergusonii]KWW07821.1 hypothetical protein VK87_0206250 [Escherichia fergusonii]